jgi:hypothetical protein
MSLQDTSPQKWLPAIASLIVVPPWVWLAVRTKDCLQIITVRSIPFQKRTIWLIKILALIVGAGGVFGAATELGTSWLFGALLSGVVIFAALKDSVPVTSWSDSEIIATTTRGLCDIGSQLVIDLANKAVVLRVYPTKQGDKICEPFNETNSYVLRGGTWQLQPAAGKVFEEKN